MKNVMLQGARKKFQKTIWSYYKKHRRSMPWRETNDPYAILVSEVMLQQTQVSRVIPKYEAFLRVFPTFERLAKARLPELLKVWQGLGYNRRALALRAAAQEVITKYDGKLPQDMAKIDELPGVGANTAAAIYVYAWNKPAVFIETNIRTVYIHHFFPRKRRVADTELFRLVAETLPGVDPKRHPHILKNVWMSPREWYYALMDYGAMLKATVGNLSKKSAAYAKQSKFKGSNRELRGKILRLLGKEGCLYEVHVPRLLHEDTERTSAIISGLERDGFLSRKGGVITLKH